jgi:hypothetical protein
MAKRALPNWRAVQNQSSLNLMSSFEFIATVMSIIVRRYLVNDSITT